MQDPRKTFQMMRNQTFKVNLHERIFYFWGGGEICVGRQVEYGQGGAGNKYLRHLQLNPQL